MTELKHVQKDERFIRHKIPEGVDPIIRFIFEEMNGQRVTKENLAEVAGIGRTVLIKWGKGVCTGNYKNVEACLNALGYTCFPPRLKR